MPIDPYTPCPGGTGKKVKFCCPDLLTELDKVQRMIEGDQRAGCLEYIDSLEGKFPERACLMSIKSMLEAQLGNAAKAEATLARFRAKYPDNPVALAEQASIAAEQAKTAVGVGLLQDALERCTDEIQPQVYDAIGLVAQALLAEGQVIAARAHLVLQLALSGSKDERALQLLLRLNGSPSVPLLAKQDMPFAQPPDDALWKTSLNAAMEPAMRGAWREADKQLTELAAKVGDWPTIWRNIAIVRSWLGETRLAIEAWRKYAAQQIPLDDAVEAEALAQLLDSEGLERVDLVTVTFAVNDIEALMARLAANPRSPHMPIDLASLGNSDEPPPKGAYWLLDRAVPDSGRDLKLADVPRIVGHVLVCGKQTDRPARLELIAFRTEVEQAKAAAGEICGDALGDATGEEVDSQVPAAQHLLSWNWRLPEDTPADHRLELMRQQRQEMLLERWPELPQQLFGGQSAIRAAADQALRIKVLAAILELELATDQQASDFDFNQLREKLGLPPLGTIDPRQLPLRDLPLVRLARVDVKKLTDEELVESYRRAEHYRQIAALNTLAHEVLARPSLEKQIGKAEVYGVLAQSEPDMSRAIGYLNEARSAAEAAKTSTAPWDLAELALRIARGDVAEADHLLHHIRGEHIREPGVAQALFQILAEAGIIGPDGKATAAAQRAGASIVVPQTATAEPGKIWTPGSPEPASGKKSALWTPGMD